MITFLRNASTSVKLLLFAGLGVIFGVVALFIGLGVKDFTLVWLAIAIIACYLAASVSSIGKEI